MFLLGAHMNRSGKSAPKQIVLYLGDNTLAIKTVEPKNRNERNELRELDKKGLVKLRIIDVSAGCIVHKGILQKLIDDLSLQKPCFEAVDRNMEAPSLLQICASNISLRKTALCPEQFEKKVCEENLLLEDYKKSGRQ